MKRIAILASLFVGAFAFAAIGAAADPGHGKHGKKGKKKFTFVLTTTDNGSCGQPWATDQEVRTFKIKNNGDGTFRVWRFDRGTFTTTGPASPGACEKSKPHGTVVKPGVVGKFHGWLVGTVSGGTFNPNATCTGPDCGFTDVFISTFFGPSAQFSCFQDSKDCRFTFSYSAPKQHLRLHHWRDWGRGAGSMLNEHFKGDISNDRVH
jgi:hypothetical protein